MQVELVRRVYGVAAAVSAEPPEATWLGGIITSSRFTEGAEQLRNSVRARSILQSEEWLRKQLSRYIPHEPTAT